jgi:hypothetical protein
VGHVAFEPGDIGLDLFGHFQQHPCCAAVGQRLSQSPALLGASPHVGDDGRLIFGHKALNSPMLNEFRPFHRRRGFLLLAVARLSRRARCIASGQPRLGRCGRPHTRGILAAPARSPLCELSAVRGRARIPECEGPPPVHTAAGLLLPFEPFTYGSPQCDELPFLGDERRPVPTPQSLYPRRLLKEEIKPCV